MKLNGVHPIGINASNSALFWVWLSLKFLTKPKLSLIIKVRIRFSYKGVLWIS